MNYITCNLREQESLRIIEQLTKYSDEQLKRGSNAASSAYLDVSDYVASKYFPFKTWLLNSNVSFGVSSNVSAASYRATAQCRLNVPISEVFFESNKLRKSTVELGLSQISHTLVEKLIRDKNGVLSGLPQITHKDSVVYGDIDAYDYSPECNVSVFAGLKPVFNDNYIIDTVISLNLGYNKPQFTGNLTYSFDLIR